MSINKLYKKSKDKQLKLLFERFGKPLSYYGQNQWKVTEDVSWDLVYQTLYKVIDVLPKYEFANEAKFRSFIFRIFINYLKNRIRDDKTRQNDTKEVELKEELLSDRVEKSENKSDKLKHLTALLEELEDWQRILLLMRSQGFSYTEIAKYTEKEEKNLKVYYGRLVKRLEKKMAPQLLKVESNEKR